MVEEVVRKHVHHKSAQWILDRATKMLLIQKSGLIFTALSLQ